MIVYGGLLVAMVLIRREGLFGGREYSLKITWPPEERESFDRGDRFLPESSQEGRS